WDLPLSYPPLPPRGRELVTSLSSRTFARQTDIADELCLPVGEFRRVLKQGIGLTFTQVRTAIRVRTAVKALTEAPTEHVRQIAFAVGYEYAGQLTRDFRMLVGMTPSCFRRLSRW